MFCKLHDKDKQKNVSEGVYRGVPYIQGADKKNSHCLKRKVIEVGFLDHPEIEYWFRVKRGNKKPVEDLGSEICVYVSMYLSHKSRKISCRSILM